MQPKNKFGLLLFVFCIYNVLSILCAMWILNSDLNVAGEATFIFEGLKPCAVYPQNVQKIKQEQAKRAASLCEDWPISQGSQGLPQAAPRVEQHSDFSVAPLMFTSQRLSCIVSQHVLFMLSVEPKLQKTWLQKRP